VHGHLFTHAAEARLHPPQSPQLSGDKRPMMLNAVYLVDADDGTGFASEVAAVAGAHPELDFNLTGPWPPYSFTAEDEGGG
jgi:gas vesicle protein GvpL/GvpF